METGIQDRLEQLIKELDAAIARAVDNPLLFAEQPLVSIETVCQQLADLDQRALAGNMPPALAAQAEALVWQVRARAGRLQTLLESASQFYSSCFSPAQPEYLAYGVHGEWSVTTHSSHLTVNC